jgi:spore coat polysaccharide biosynthesis protein SpsF
MNNSIVNILTVIQARMSSTRLPNKVMMELADKTVLTCMYERVNAARLAGDIIVATTTNKEDDQIVELCWKENIKCFRGHPTDLLDRHYKAGLKYNADVVIKIPSDCPLIDPNIIDRVIKYFINNEDKYDYVSNLHPATYPDGNDVEIVKMDVLKTAWSSARKVYEREHTTPFIWENPDKFRIGNVAWETGLDYSMSHRWVLDYEDDYKFIHRVFEELYYKNHFFSLEDILNLLKRKPEIAEINNRYAGVNWYRNYMKELKTVTAGQTRFI